MSKENNLEILENQSKPVDIEGINKIIDQMRNFICQIFKNKDETCSGFFCIFLLKEIYFLF